MTKEKEVKELHYGGDSGFPPRRRRRRPIREPRRRPPPRDFGGDPRRRPSIPLRPDGQGVLNPRMVPADETRDPRRRPPLSIRRAMELFNRRQRYNQQRRSKGRNVRGLGGVSTGAVPRGVYRNSLTTGKFGNAVGNTKKIINQAIANPTRTTPRRSTRMVANGGVITKNRIGANDFREGGYVLSTVDNRKNKK